jgi:hypothetical protein
MQIQKCIRCGEDHLDLEVKAFMHPVGVGGGPYTHWVLCPTTQEPVLIRYDETAA